MKIQIYCQKCNKLELVEKSFENTEMPSAKKLTIPIPNHKNGLTTYSIVHSDHTLIVDIDADGNVRGEKTIDRIDQKLEKSLAEISSKLLQYLDSDPSEPLSFVIITKNNNLRKMLLGVFQQLIFNINNEIHGLLSVSKEAAILEYGKITVYIGNWADKIYNLVAGDITFVYDINKNNYVNVMQNVAGNCKQYSNSNFALLYESTFVKSEIGKICLGDLMLQIPSLQILDFGEAEKAATSLLTIVERAVTHQIRVHTK